MKVIDQAAILRTGWWGLKAAVARVLSLPGINHTLISAARMLPKHVGHRLPLAREQVLFRLAAAEPVVLLDPRKDHVARDIFWGQGRPTSVADARMLRLAERLAADARVFVDVGAYAGLFALMAARANPALRAIAYEIVPENFLLLVRNILANDLAPRVDARLVGVGEAEYTIRIPVSFGLPSHESSISLDSTFAEGVAIPIRPLDRDLVGIEGPFVIKIDVEGCEAVVFEGATEWIARWKPDIICELLEDTRSASTVERILAGHGYRRFINTERGFEERRQVQPDRAGRDWLFTIRRDIDDVFAGI